MPEQLRSPTESDPAAKVRIPLPYSNTWDPRHHSHKVCVCVCTCVCVCVYAEFAIAAVLSPDKICSILTLGACAKWYCHFIGACTMSAKYTLNRAQC